MTDEKMRNLDATDDSFHLNRREFLGLVGGGIVVFISCGDSPPMDEGGARPIAAEAGFSNPGHRRNLACLLVNATNQVVFHLHEVHVALPVKTPIGLMKSYR